MILARLYVLAIITGLLVNYVKERKEKKVEHPAQPRMKERKKCRNRDTRQGKRVKVPR